MQIVIGFAECSCQSGHSNRKVCLAFRSVTFKTKDVYIQLLKYYVNIEFMNTFFTKFCTAEI